MGIFVDMVLQNDNMEMVLKNIAIIGGRRNMFLSFE